MNAKMKEMPPSLPKVNQIQRRYLQDRLAVAARRKDTDDKMPVPANIAAAEKLRERADKALRVWHSAKYKREQRNAARVREAQDKVRQVILFGTPDEALAAVEAFEKLTP